MYICIHRLLYRITYINHNYAYYNISIMSIFRYNYEPRTGSLVCLLSSRVLIIEMTSSLADLHSRTATAVVLSFLSE